MSATSTPSAHTPPREVAVVGAGMVGLATAWHLQELGVDVTVIDRTGVAAGASWGNAGWLTPSLTAPLPEPAVLRYGLRTALQPSSPVYVPPQPDPSLWRFLAGFTRHCTTRHWERGARAYGPVNAQALEAFDELAAAGDVPAPEPADPFLACFRQPEDREPLRHELDALRRLGQPVSSTDLTGAEARALEPSVGPGVGAAVRIEGQQFIQPPTFLAALGDAVTARGGKIVTGLEVDDVREVAGGVEVAYAGGATARFDAAVLATGAWLGRLARGLGVRRLVQAGRGYSFSVAGGRVPTRPVYFPTQRVACTPLETPDGPRLRVAGMMEFRAADAPLDRRRVRAIAGAVRDLLPGLDFDDRQDEWVGSRPCTTDGLPLVGATRSPRIFVGGGHGMWGIALGPVTGRLLARHVVSGVVPAELVAFDPLR